MSSKNLAPGVRVSKADYDPDLYKLRHSVAHILAQAVRDLFGQEADVKFAGGPPIADGFYYDFQLSRPLISQDLHAIEERMKSILSKPSPFVYEEISAESAAEIFKHQPFKLEVISGLLQGEVDENGDGTRPLGSSAPILSIYKHQDFADLCRGPHVGSSEQIPVDGFKLLSVAGAYWRGDEKRPMLQRIYGTAFFEKVHLDLHLQRLELASQRDHRKIGKEQKLFFFHETAPGMPYWMPKGFAILNLLIAWWREVHEREDYQEISSPLINSKKLWEVSGHWDHYRDDMFVMNVSDDEVYGVKPMNCPNAMIVFKQEHHSYRDLPLRLSDCDALHRHERSGALHGLLRVQKFQQDDAHIFVADEAEAIEAEFGRILDLVEEFYSVFGLSYRFRLATRPSDSIGDDELWGRAEGALHAVLKKHVGDDYEIAEGDGAFYGPKIDIVIEDALGRDWQMGTLQLDYQLPRRFDCRYVDANGQRQFPVVIHRVIYGSMERFIGILIEHCAGNFPLWLSPVQVRVLPVSAAHEDSARELVQKLKKSKIRVELDPPSNSLGRRIKQFRLDRVPMALVIGDNEVASGRVALRERGKNEVRNVSCEDFVNEILGRVQRKEN